MSLPWSVNATSYAWPKEDRDRYAACVDKWDPFDGEWVGLFKIDRQALTKRDEPLFVRLQVFPESMILYLKRTTGEPWQQVGIGYRSRESDPMLDKIRLGTSFVSTNPAFPEVHSIHLERRWNTAANVIYGREPMATYMKQKTIIEILESRDGRMFRPGHERNFDTLADYFGECPLQQPRRP